MKTIGILSGKCSRARIAVITLAAALGLGVAAVATAAPEHGGRGHHMFQGIEKLHASLNLNTEQEAMWQHNTAQMKQAAQAARARQKEVRGNLRAALEQPNVDLRSLLAQADSARAQGIAARHQAQEQWLALYDKLDAGQREQVRVFLKGRLEKGDTFRAKMKERWDARRNAAPKTDK